MNLFLTIAFLFFIGSMAGWGIEVVFRRFFSSANPERKWINPGFLSGPYLPLYGFSLCVLFLLSLLEQYIPIENTALRKAALFAVMAAAVTLVEYIAGLISIKLLSVSHCGFQSVPADSCIECIRSLFPHRHKTQRLR